VRGPPCLDVRSGDEHPVEPTGAGNEEDAVTQSPDTVPDGPHPQGTGIRDDAPTLSGLPDDAPDELRATLSGGDPEQLPVDAEPTERDR
jgi:hypothetical protein